MHHPTDRIIHTTAFVTPVMEHWLEQETAQWVHPTKDRSDDPLHHERSSAENYILLQYRSKPISSVISFFFLPVADRGRRGLAGCCSVADADGAGHSRQPADHRELWRSALAEAVPSGHARHTDHQVGTEGQGQIMACKKRECLVDGKTFGAPPLRIYNKGSTVQNDIYIYIYTHTHTYTHTHIHIYILPNIYIYIYISFIYIFL